MGQREETRGRINPLLLALKMEERGHKPEAVVASGRRKQPSGYSHQKDGDHNPTLQRNEQPE